jgi:hypothetical protein
MSIEDYAKSLMAEVTTPGGKNFRVEWMTQHGRRKPEAEGEQAKAEPAGSRRGPVPWLFQRRWKPVSILAMAVDRTRWEMGGWSNCERTENSLVVGVICSPKRHIVIGALFR